MNIKTTGGRNKMKQFDIDKLQEGMSEYRELVEEVRTELNKPHSHGYIAYMARSIGISPSLLHHFIKNYNGYEMKPEIMLKLYKIISFNLEMEEEK